MRPAADGAGDSPRDTVGCLLLAFRTGCGMALIQILMAVAIIAAAILSLIFFR